MGNVGSKHEQYQDTGMCQLRTADLNGASL